MKFVIRFTFKFSTFSSKDLNVGEFLFRKENKSYISCLALENVYAMANHLKEKLEEQNRAFKMQLWCQSAACKIPIIQFPFYI